MGAFDWQLSRATIGIMKPPPAGILPVLLSATIALCALALPALAYEAPTGFNDHNWGSPLVAFKGLVLWHANKAAGTRGRVTDFKLECVQDPASGETCSPRLSRVTQEVTGDGTHALAEYYFDKDHNPWVAQNVDLLTISYLFCANAKGDYLPATLRKSLALCGARVLFRSDPADVVASKGEDYESNYERLLHALVGRYGAPPGYTPRGLVIIESLDEHQAQRPQAPRSVHLRWCGLDFATKAVHPTCPATVTLAYDSQRGEGSVLFATAPVYEFAFARYDLGDVGNDLYRLLGDRPLDVSPRRQTFECTGSHICGPAHGDMSARDLRAFQP